MEVCLPIAYITDRSRKSAQVRGISFGPSQYLWLITKCPLLPVTIIFSDRAESVSLLDRRHFR